MGVKEVEMDFGSGFEVRVELHKVSVGRSGEIVGLMVQEIGSCSGFRPKTASGRKWGSSELGVKELSGDFKQEGKVGVE